MHDEPRFDQISALLGDESRARILAMLMDGRAFTATELSTAGGVVPSTASSHLSQLREAGLIEVQKQGRHRYYRISDPEIARILESLMGLAGRKHAADLDVGPREAGLRYARVCYDHLAGEVAVHLYEQLQREGFIGMKDGEPFVTSRGEEWCMRLGIDLAGLRHNRRRLCRSCLDWSERRMHLAGALGAAILKRLLALRYVRRDPSGRVVHVTREGRRFLDCPQRLPNL
jgi:DNA-binding transcriptional ArsR family regulator